MRERKEEELSGVEEIKIGSFVLPIHRATTNGNNAES